MTIIQKLSDRDNFIFEAIKLVLVNEGNMHVKDLQYKLFQCGVFISPTLLKQAISVLNSKGLITKPNVQPAESVQKEESEAGV